MAEEMEKSIRKMPESKEAEESVLGCMLMDRDAIQKAMDILVPEDFQYNNTKLMFECICEIYEADEVVDPITLQDRLRAKNAPESIADMAHLNELIDRVPSSVRINTYAKIVKDKSALRNVINVMGEVTKECYESGDDVDVILEDTEKKVIQLLEKRGGSDYEPIGVVAQRAFMQIDAAAKSGGSVTGVATGYTELDNKTAGFHGSELILIAARPAMGKTAFALNIALNAARKGHCVALFSLEMSKESLVQRLFAMDASIDAGLLRTGNLDWKQWESLATSQSDISKMKIILDDTPAITVQELRTKCRKYKLEMGLDMIMIDYLQLMGGGGKTESRQNEVAEISRSLKALARELDVPVVALSQLSRAVEQRDKDNKRPQLSDLRESGAIEQDADLVMFIYRDDYYNKDSEEKNISEIIIAKQRAGSTGTVKLVWMPEYTKFGNMERQDKSSAGY